jgi:hypothetical protein
MCHDPERCSGEMRADGHSAFGGGVSNRRILAMMIVLGLIALAVALFADRKPLPVAPTGLHVEEPQA